MKFIFIVNEGVVHSSQLINDGYNGYNGGK